MHVSRTTNMCWKTLRLCSKLVFIAWSQLVLRQERPAWLNIIFEHGWDLERQRNMKRRNASNFIKLTLSGVVATVDKKITPSQILPFQTSAMWLQLLHSPRDLPFCYCSWRGLLATHLIAAYNITGYTQKIERVWDEPCLSKQWKLMKELMANISKSATLRK